MKEKHNFTILIVVSIVLFTLATSCQPQDDNLQAPVANYQEATPETTEPLIQPSNSTAAPTLNVDEIHASIVNALFSLYIKLAT
ncbi:MAG: hypothetical protein M5U05_08210 [Anaerolineales bacterium]|nr:hypothetical protein [Anaerolineales bacterium]